MIYKSEIGWIYKNREVYLKLEWKYKYKLIKYWKIIKSVNISKKAATLVISKKSIVLNKIDYIDYDLIQWVFSIYNTKKIFKNSHEIIIVDVGIANWEYKNKNFKIMNNNFEIVKNKIYIEYKKEWAFLIFLYINEIIKTSKNYDQTLELKLDNNSILWNENNISKLIKKLLNAKTCEIKANKNFQYYLELKLDDKLVIDEWTSQTN